MTVKFELDLEKHFAGSSVLVTGGAGFVGSNIVRHLLGFGARVTILDNFETGSEENLRGLDGYELLRGSVTDIEVVRQAITDVDLVIHAAARNIIVSTRNPKADYEVNIGGTLNVLLAARDARVSRVVYTSSASVYGNSRHLPVMEDDHPSLLSPYAVSKFAGESYCQAFYESYGVPAAMVRYSNVYGRGQSPSNPYCGVVAKFFDAAAKGEAIVIHGDGQQTRDFTYVDDAVEATLIAAVSPRALGEVFNVGTGFETDINSLAAEVLKVVGGTADIQHIDRRDIDNIRRRVMNIEKIRRMLHWVPEHTLRSGLIATRNWLASI